MKIKCLNEDERIIEETMRRITLREKSIERTVQRWSEEWHEKEGKNQKKKSDISEEKNG